MRNKNIDMIKVESNIEIEIKEVIENKVKEAVSTVIGECSKEYFRDIAVEFNVKIK